MAVEKTKTTTLILFVFRLIPKFVRKAIFISLFIIFYHLDSRRRLITLHNLQRSFPEKNYREIIKIAKGTYRHFAIVGAEFPEIPYITKENAHKWLDVDGYENYLTANAKGKGILSIVAHFGNWELLPVGIPIYARPIHIVYRPLDNKIIDNVVEYVRTMRGNSLIPKGGSGKKIMELLKQNQINVNTSDDFLKAFTAIQQKQPLTPDQEKVLGSYAKATISKPGLTTQVAGLMKTIMNKNPASPGTPPAAGTTPPAVGTTPPAM